MNKKGVTQTQFNWIFIMIAGALILLFFISMVYKQKSVSEQKAEIVIQKNLQEILTQAEISKQTEQIIKAPEKEFRYSCEGFSVGSLAAFNPRIVFAPDLLKSNTRELILYSLEWRVPFRIVNFLYVISPEIRYIIVDDNDNLNSVADQLYNLLPENIDKGESVIKFSDLSDIKDKNNYKIKIIFFNKNNININLNNIKNTKDEDISIINIKGDELDEDGDIGFYKYKKNNPEKTLPFLKKESVIAAVFSENAEIYECNMKKAISRLKKVYDVYKKRADELRDKKEGCNTYYDVNLNPNFNDYSNIYDNIKNIENQNNGAQILSCPLIY